jgi:hypothetical protein
MSLVFEEVCGILSCLLVKSLICDDVSTTAVINACHRVGVW